MSDGSLTRPPTTSSDPLTASEPDDHYELELARESIVTSTHPEPYIPERTPSMKEVATAGVRSCAREVGRMLSGTSNTQEIHSAVSPFTARLRDRQCTSQKRIDQWTGIRCCAAALSEAIDQYLENPDPSDFLIETMRTRRLKTAIADLNQRQYPWYKPDPVDSFLPYIQQRCRAIAKFPNPGPDIGRQVSQATRDFIAEFEFEERVRRSRGTVPIVSEEEVNHEDEDGDLVESTV